MNNLDENLGVAGKTVVITGATGHLGKNLSIKLATLGIDLILVDLNEEALLSLREAIQKASKVDVALFECDLEDSASRAQLVHRIRNKFQKIDYLVNNAAFVGTSDLHGWNEDFSEQSIETWRRCQEVNLAAVFDLCKGLTGLISESKAGSIVNVSSIYSIMGPDWGLYKGTKMGNPAAYGVSKAGLNQLTRWLAATLGPTIRVNSVSPGGISRGQDPSFVELYSQKVAGRMATEDDVTGCVIFLLSELSRYVTGQNLVVDGGYSVM